MITKPRSRSYSQKMVHLLSIIQIFKSDSRVRDINTAFSGINLIRYFGSVTWYSLPNVLRKICYLNLFKTTVQIWKPSDGPCRLCKNYLDGFYSFPYFTFCKNKITVLIAIHWKTVCEIFRDIVG